jgi:hypothetical protein
MPSGLAWAELIPPQALALWANEATRPGLVLLGVAALIFFIPTASRRDRQVSQPRASDEDIQRPTNTGWWRRQWWKLHPPVDLMAVDGLVIDRTRKPHCAWLGPTGAGKSASVATVRMDGARPTLAAMPDTSDPVREAALRLDGFIWTAGVSTVPVDFLIGSPTEVAERLTEVFRSGGVGAWKRAARRATADVIRAIDASPEPRTLQLIGELLREAVSKDRNLSTVCAGWVDRFLDLADQFGPSIGAGGVDIADLLRQGRTVVLDNDAFSRPSLGGDVVALALAEAKRCAALVPGGFRLIFEEAGQLGDRIDLAEPFHRAGRRRKIMVDDLTQAESDLVFHGNDGITANLGTRVYFAQELKSLQKVAADRLGLDYRELDPSRMRDFTAWVAHGRIRRLVRFPKPPKARLSVADILSSDLRTPRNGHTERTVPRAIERMRGVLPELPPPSTEWAMLMGNVYIEGGCERWSGKHDRAGHEQACAKGCTKRHQHRVGCPLDCAIKEHVDNCYGLVWWPLAEPTETRTHEWQRVHRVRWRLAYGPIPLDPVTGKPLTIDHCRTCPKDCSKLGHLAGAVPREENTKRSWRVRGISGQAAAD